MILKMKMEESVSIKKQIISVRELSVFTILTTKDFSLIYFFRIFDFLGDC